MRGASLIAISFQLAGGMTALFGSENKQLQEKLIKLNGVMAVTQSLQAIGTELTREDSIVKVVAGKATDIYSWAVSGATLKMCWDVTSWNRENLDDSQDRKSTRLNSSHRSLSRMPSSA